MLIVYLQLIICAASVRFAHKHVPFKLSTLKGVPEASDFPVTITDSTKRSTQNLAKWAVLSNVFLALTSPKSARAVGYKAAESIYSPSSELYFTPFLPQSALLNTVPIESPLIGDIQAYVESFVQLINPSARQQLQLQSNTSALWNNLRINSQRAAGMFIYNSRELTPIIDINDYSDLSLLRGNFSEKYLYRMRQALLLLVNASRASDPQLSLARMRAALTALCNVASALVPINDTYPGVGPLTPQLEGIPRLRGRATVKLAFARPANAPAATADIPTVVDTQLSDESLSSNPTPNTTPLGDVTLIVDGLNFPLTGGNFIDLCLRGFYNGRPIGRDKYSYKQQATIRTIIGRGDTGVSEDSTGRPRRVPLEVLREESNGTRFTALGSARNSMVFTKATPVLSYATEGAVGMFHEETDPDSASTAFFFVPTNTSMPTAVLSQEPLYLRLSNRYSLFAYIVDGIDVIDKLIPGDIVKATSVEAGAWDLIKPGKTYLNPPEILYSGENTVAPNF